jgi:glycosyltransferase involved in cell wall biosynthesis
MTMKPLSVLLITPQWARDGGVGAHVQASAQVLAREGIDVSVLVERVESDERIEGVALYQREQLCDARCSPEERLGEVLSDQPAIAHLHQIDDPDIVAALQPRVPVVISAHGYTACASGLHYFRPGHECTRAHGVGCVPYLPVCTHVRNPGRLPGKYQHAARGLEALRRADLAVSYSSAVDRHLAASRIHRRVLVPYFPTMTPKRGPPAAERRVLFAGRVVSAKGVAVLIRAAREVDAEFFICGDGRQGQAMRKLARRMGLERRIHFTGWLAGGELAAQVAAASVIALPSLWPEPFGLIGIEAHAASRPVVASDTGGVRDWLEDGVNGLCVRPGDTGELARALNELLADLPRREAMGAAGKRSVSARFSAKRHLDVLLDAYRGARDRWAGARPEEATETGAPQSSSV